MGKIYLNDIGYGGVSGPASGDQVYVNPVFNSGAKLADIIVNNTITPIYMPANSEVLDVWVDGNSVLDQYNVAQIDLTGKQDLLTAGTNINITSNVISAIDTTYNDFDGTNHGLVPAPASGDSGYLKVDGTWDEPNSLPSVTSSDEGKALIVDSNGDWSADNIPSQLPSVTSSDQGKVLTVNSNGEWAAAMGGGGGGTVTDVRIDNTSILDGNGVANITTMTGAGSSTAGAKGLVPAPASGDNSKYLRGDGTWATPSGGGGGASNLNDLGDVAITTPTQAQILKYNSSTSKWENITGGSYYTDITGTLTAGSTTLTLSSPYITTTSTIDVYTDTYGVNPTAITTSSGSITLTFSAQQSNLGVKVRISNDGTGGGGGASILNDLIDVNILSPTNNQILKYNGTAQKWENANESGGGINYSTTEQNTGLKWIDGKTLYQKTIQYNNYVYPGAYTVIDSTLKTSNIGYFMVVASNFTISGYSNQYSFFDNNQMGITADGVFVQLSSGATSATLTVQYTKVSS